MKVRAWRQRYWVFWDKLFAAVGVELVLHCKTCGRQVDAHNLTNHFTWHEQRGEEWGPIV